MPATYARLAAGDMPVEWFDRLLRTLRDLTPFQRAQVDERVSTFDLASLPVDSCRRSLKLLLAWFDPPEPEVAPLRALRYAVMTRSILDTGGIEAARSRVRGAGLWTRHFHLLGVGPHRGVRPQGSRHGRSEDPGEPPRPVLVMPISA